MRKMYAVYYYVSFQDGHEDGWRLFNTIEEVEEYITPNPNRHSDLTTYKVYEVTIEKELKFKTEITDIPQPPIRKAVTKVYNA